MDSKTLAEIKAYLQDIKYLFVEGNLRLVSEWWEIKILYKDNFIDFTLKEKVPEGNEEAILKVVSFCFDCYCDNERKGETLNSETLGKLLHLRPWSVRSILSRIYKKLYIYGEPILQQEGKVENLQDNWQESTRDRISEEQSPTDIRGEEERA